MLKAARAAAVVSLVCALTPVAACSRLPSAHTSVPMVAATNGQVVHAVIRTQVGSRIEASESDIWVDPKRSITRVTLHILYAPMESPPLREILVRDGIATVYYPSGQGVPSPSASKTDATSAAGGFSSDDPVARGDVNAYRRLLASKEATITRSSDVDGVPTYRLRVDTGSGTTDGTSLVVDVRRSDFLPVRLEGTHWDLNKGKTEILATWTSTYLLVDTVPRSRVPSGTFDLLLPPKTSVSADYGITPNTAASMTSPVVWWLGPAYGGQPLRGARLRYKQVPQVRAWTDMAPAETWPPYTTPGVDVRWVEAGYPVPAFVRVEGKQIPATSTASLSQFRSFPPAVPFGITVFSFDPIARSEWKFHPGAAIRTVVVGGRKALLATFTRSQSGIGARETWDMSFLVLDMGKTTVVLQGEGIHPEQLMRAASSLRRVKG